MHAVLAAPDEMNVKYCDSATSARIKAQDVPERVCLVMRGDASEGCVTFSTDANIRITPLQSTSLRDLKGLGSLKHEDLGFAPPNQLAISIACTVIETIQSLENSHAPSRIAASAEEGVGISFREEGRRALLECYNDGTIVAGIIQPGEKVRVRPVTAENLEIREALEWINGFLSNSRTA